MRHIHKRIITSLIFLTNNLLNNKLTKIIYQNNNILVYDNLFFRWLSFGGLAVQSKVCNFLKYCPCLPVFQIISLAGILYQELVTKREANTDNQHKILLLGLGGGDILRYFHKLFNMEKNNNLSIEVIELSPDVINIAKQFFYIDRIIKNNIVISQQDAYEYILNNTNKTHDIIVLDFFTEVNSAMRLIDKTYIENLYKILSQNGVLVINILFSNSIDIENFIKLINGYFNKNILIISSISHYNIVIFAFKNEKYLNYITDHNNSNLINGFIKNLEYCDYKGYCADIK